MSTLGADYVHLDGRPGGAEANATIVVTNNTAPKDKLGVVVMSDANGAWQADVWGHKGETLQVTQSIGGHESPSINFIIR